MRLQSMLVLALVVVVTIYLVNKFKIGGGVTALGAS